MKALIKGISNVDSEGVTLVLTKPVSYGGTFKSKTWIISWDELGRLLFKDQYIDAVSVDKLQAIRETHK